MRTCVGCRRRMPAADLIRVAAIGDGGLAVARTASGRGAWLCAATAVACAEVARRRGAFERALRVQLQAGAAEVLVEALSAIDPTRRSMGDCLPASDGSPPAGSDEVVPKG